MVSVDLSSPDMQRLIGDLNVLDPVLERAIEAGVEGLMVVGIGYLQQEAPVSPGGGDLKGSMGPIFGPTRSGDIVSGGIGSSLEYAAQRNYGGTIYPRNGEFLVFEGDEVDENGDPVLVFARSVTQEGDDYLGRAEKRIDDIAAETIGMAVQRALSTLGGS